MKEYLLDTNAYYNLLAYSNAANCGSDGDVLDIISTLKSGKVLISTITQIEIISVLGKYARGGGGCSKCERTISPDGKKCPNTMYTPKRKKWNRKRIAGFRKLINETIDGTSKLISVSILPFDQDTILEAKKKLSMHLRIVLRAWML